MPWTVASVPADTASIAPQGVRKPRLGVGCALLQPHPWWSRT